MTYSVKTILLPDDHITDAIYAIYRELFGEEEITTVRDIFDGKETGFARDMLVYAADECGNVHGTVLATQSLKLPTLGTINGVGVLPAARGNKLAERCCQAALEYLDGQGVRASFLGTGNPQAARLYEKLGFHFVSGTSLMVRFQDRSDDIYSFFRDLYPGGDVLEIKAGSAEIRQTIIPLVLACRNQALDPVNGLFEYPAVLFSCQGLYPRYSALPGKGGEFFQISTQTGALAVLGMLRSESGKDCFINVMAHEKYLSEAAEMWRLLREKAAERFQTVHVAVSENNIERQEMLKSLDFTCSGSRIFAFSNLQIPYCQYTFQSKK